MKLGIISANCGSFDPPNGWDEQFIPGVEIETLRLTDLTFPPRSVMHPRLQAKIPKFFPWQFMDADVYLWVDASFELRDGAAAWMLERMGNAEAAFFRHPRRKTLADEFSYMKASTKSSAYLRERYDGEWIDALHAKLVRADLLDLDLLASGIFVIRDTADTANFAHRWWYYVSRYCVQDQLSLPAALAEADVDFTAIDADIYRNPYFVQQPRRQHA